MSPKATWSVLVTVVMVSASMFALIGVAVAAIPTASNHFDASPLRGSTLYDSTNWAGYFATNTASNVNYTVTYVSGTWTVPTVTCKSGTAITSMWVGIDGAISDTVEQTGTSSQCSGTTASYNAWWELYPLNAEQPISSITVHAGDSISASVTYSSSTGKFTMAITDGTHSFSKTATQSGTLRNSAECIVERPSGSSGLYRLAKFASPAQFATCTATINGASGAIGSFPVVGQIDMVNSGGTIIASTSALSSNQSTFSVTWKGYG
jgi:Peptidase A4 family